MTFFRKMMNFHRTMILPGWRAQVFLENVVNNGMLRVHRRIYVAESIHSALFLGLFCVTCR